MLRWLDFWNSETTIYVNARHGAAHYRQVAEGIARMVPGREARVLDYGCGKALSADLTVRSDPLHPSEQALLKRLLELPEEVGIAAERRAPHRLTSYVHEVAQDFSAFYRDCRVAGAAEDGEDEDFRIALSVQAQRVIARCLGLLGVATPESM